MGLDEVHHRDRYYDDDEGSADGQPSEDSRLSDREIMIICLTILGVILALAAVIVILRCVCKRWFGRTCRVICETDSHSLTAVDTGIDGVIICDSQPRHGKMPETTDLALAALNRGFTPTPDDPIFTVPFSGQPGSSKNWEFGERINPTPGNRPTFPGQNNYIYDGQLRLPPSSSSVSIRAESGEAFRDDHRLEELHRVGMTRSETITVGSKLVVFISREVSHLGDTLVLRDMGISLTIPPYAIEAGRTELISLILDWDLGDFPGMKDEETIISPVVHCGPHGLKLNKPAVLSYKHCAYERGDVALVSSETHLMQSKDWRQVCERDDSNKPYHLLPNEVQIQVSHFTLYTCLAEGKTTKKWMQLAVFGGKMRAKRRYEIRVYFLNNTPCALQFAIQNEAKNHFRQLCPRKEFLFQGDGEDIVAMIQHVNEGWSHRLDDRKEVVPYLSLWHGKCPNVSFIFKHENEHVRDIDIRLAVYQRGREDNESEKTTLKVLASMRSGSTKQNNSGNTQAVIHVFPPRHGKRRRYQSEGSSSSRTDSISSTSTESSATFSSVSSNTSSSSSHLSSNTSEDEDVTSKPEDQGKQQSCIQNMQIHIHPSSADPLQVSTQRIIPHELCMELIVLLDPLAPLGNDWRVLASALEMDSLIPLLKNTPAYNPTQTLLEEAERQTKSLEWMASVMVSSKRLDAANAIMKYANKSDNTCVQNES